VVDVFSIDSSSVLWRSFAIVLIYFIWQIIDTNGDFNKVLLNIGTIMPLTVLLASLTLERRGFVMFTELWVKRRIAKAIAEGKAEAKAESKTKLENLQSEWEAWVKNGKDPKNMPEPPKDL
jgi:uncharacterized protein YjfI (DUF2170 family)